MDKIVIQGGGRLVGEVQVSGAKNSALKLLFASLLAEGKHCFTNVPRLKDVESTQTLLEALGSEVSWDKDVFVVNVKRPATLAAHYDVVRKMRASILCMGPLLTKYGEAAVSLPGGCAIGTRPIDQHLEGMKALGAEITVAEGYVHAVAPKGGRLRGGRYLFETVTVGGTENVMMAATLANGVTVLENAAKEPEIVDLANYLNLMGAQVKGAGSSVIEITGVEQLRPAEYKVMPDRIEAGTLLVAAAITQGDVRLVNAKGQHLEAVLKKLEDFGAKVTLGENSIELKMQGQGHSVDITTSPYPHFPTDLQAQWMALMTVAEGTSVITENVFENRFMHVQELVRLGADIIPKNRVAVVRGNPGKLTGAPVMATDLRASASLVLAGLVAKGETTVSRIYHLDRGYERLEEKLKTLGAKTARVRDH